jgi:very-short-patch-repair endonuclease
VKLNVEINGGQHLINPKQLDADIKRDSYSREKGWDTIRIPNDNIRKNLNKVADSIADVVRKRYWEQNQ